MELTETARDVLQARYNERGDNVYVFQNDSNRSRGKPISRSKIHAEIQYAVDKLKARKLLPQDAVISMHSSRKTVATIAHLKGEDLEVISKMLGHRSTEHTRAYIGITQAKVDALRTKYSTGIKRGKPLMKKQLSRADAGAHKHPGECHTDNINQSTAGNDGER